MGLGTGANLTSLDGEIRKSLTIGAQNPQMSGGGSLLQMSLERTMRSTTYSDKHIKLIKRLAQLAAGNTVVQYQMLDSYGPSRAGAFTREGETPQQLDSAYRRALEQIKFMGTQRGISHPATVADSAFGDLVGLETINGTKFLLYCMERAGWRGDSTTIPESYNGIWRQILTHPRAGRDVSLGGNVMDLRGGIIQQADVEIGVNTIINAFGVPTDMMLASVALSDFSKTIYATQRSGLPMSVSQGVLGASIQKFISSGFEIDLDAHVFLRSGEPGGSDAEGWAKNPPNAASSPKAPVAPTLAVAAAVAAAGSQFVLADVGTYRWTVTGINRFGESAAAALQTGSIAAAGDGETLTITDGGGTGDQLTTGYRLYRTKFVNGASGTEEFFIEIPRNPVLTATTVFLDLNADIPGTSNALISNMDLDVLGTRQLLPMLKLPLATTGPSIQWMQLVYLCLILYQPRQTFMLRNVADR
jgi:hypothetical protein